MECGDRPEDRPVSRCSPGSYEITPDGPVDLASGGGWPVDLSSTAGISDMYVDWVRVYSKVTILYGGERLDRKSTVVTK